MVEERGSAVSSAGRLAHPSSFTPSGARCDAGHPALLVSSETLRQGRGGAAERPTTGYSFSETRGAPLNIRAGSNGRGAACSAWRPSQPRRAPRLRNFRDFHPSSASKPPSPTSGSESSFPARGWIPRRPPKRRTDRLTVSTGTVHGGHAAAAPPGRAPSPLGARWLHGQGGGRAGWRGQGWAGGLETRAPPTAPASSSAPTSHTAR